VTYVGFKNVKTSLASFPSPLSQKILKDILQGDKQWLINLPKNRLLNSRRLSLCLIRMATVSEIKVILINTVTISCIRQFGRVFAFHPWIGPPSKLKRKEKQKSLNRIAFDNCPDMIND
jgi:hypothetical protein